MQPFRLRRLWINFSHHDAVECAAREKKMKLFQRFAIFAVIIKFVEYANEIVVLLDAIVTRKNRDKCLEPPTIIFYRSPQISCTHLFC